MIVYGTGREAENTYGAFKGPPCCGMVIFRFKFNKDAVSRSPVKLRQNQTGTSHACLAVYK